MKMTSLRVENFRSIDQVEIKECGIFNVLIGRNNSGKSNILSAIDAFFKVLHHGGLLATKSPIPKLVDFHNQETSNPIGITVGFSLTDQLVLELLSNIVNDAPQMRNAVEALRGFDRLNVTITFTAPPHSFAYISTITISDTKAATPSDRVLLAVEGQTAFELYQRESRREELSGMARALLSMPERVPKELLRRGSEQQRVSIRYYLRDLLHEPVNSKLEQVVEEIVKEAETPEDFVRVARGYASKWEEETRATQALALRQPLNTFAGAETAVPDYVSKLIDRFAEIKILHLQERRKQIGRDEANRLLELKMSRGGPSILRSLQETVSTLLGVQIDAFRSDEQTGRSGSETAAELDVDNFLVQVNGAGIREALRLILDYEFIKPAILLVEEPEVHLHPGLETSMMRYLRRLSGATQVFLTTHSTNFLDTAAMSNVYLISRAPSTQIQSFDAGQAEDRLPEELGLRMSSLFLYDRLVFVEGRIDEAIIREWASILGVNLSSANVGFIHMGGARNFAYYAAEKTLSFLCKRKVKTWFLLDRDDCDDSEIQRFLKIFAESTHVQFLERREIENYLVSAQALERFIRCKLDLSRSADSPPNAETIQLTILDCGEKLRDIALAKRVAKRACFPVYPSLQDVTELQDGSSVADRVRKEVDRMISELTSAKEAVDVIVEEQKTLLNEQWDKKFCSIVPGDLLLDCVCKKFGVRYKKDKDGARLASMMHADEIASDIKATIRAVGTI
jgi:putative ATP-dependent endonuclease of the OLD family